MSGYGIQLCFFGLSVVFLDGACACACSGVQVCSSEREGSSARYQACRTRYSPLTRESAEKGRTRDMRGMHRFVRRVRCVCQYLKAGPVETNSPGLLCNAHPEKVSYTQNPPGLPITSSCSTVLLLQHAGLHPSVCSSSEPL